MNYNVAIIGGGPAGYTAAETAGKAGLSVILFEKQSLGGVCLNEGCIPTKTLLYSAKVYDTAKHAAKYAIQVTGTSFDLPKIISRKAKVVRKLVLGIKAKMAEYRVDVVIGEACVVDSHTIACNGIMYACDNILLCSGSETFVPPILGIEQISYWTHREALNAKELPASLTIVGGGVIGMEFASFFNSLGTEVTVIEMMDEIVGGVDKELAALLRTEYAKRGITFMLQTEVTSFTPTLSEEKGVHYSYRTKTTDEEGVVSFNLGEGKSEVVLMSVGRRPVTKGIGLENLSLQTTDRGHIIVNEWMQSSTDHVYICGDLTGFSLLAHTAVREAEVAVHHILGKEDKMSYRAIPGVVYTNPEIAGVGRTEESLLATQTPYRAVKLPMAYSGRFVAENEGVNGMCKLLIGTDDNILGVHVLGNPASEIITLAGMAIETGMKAGDWKKIVFPHPTVAEIFREGL